MTNAPGDVGAQQLRELNIRLRQTAKRRQARLSQDDRSHIKKEDLYGRSQ